MFRSDRDVTAGDYEQSSHWGDDDRDGGRVAGGEVVNCDRVGSGVGHAMLLRWIGVAREAVMMMHTLLFLDAINITPYQSPSMCLIPVVLIRLPRLATLHRN